MVEDGQLRFKPVRCFCQYRRIDLECFLVLILHRLCCFYELVDDGVVGGSSFFVLDVDRIVFFNFDITCLGSDDAVRGVFIAARNDSTLRLLFDNTKFDCPTTIPVLSVANPSVVLSHLHERTSNSGRHHPNMRRAKLRKSPPMCS